MADNVNELGINYHSWKVYFNISQTFSFQAEEALSFLLERRDFWAQQNPDFPPKPDVEVVPAWQKLFCRVIKTNLAVKMIGHLNK